jgi:hypothetical protein
MKAIITHPGHTYNCFAIKAEDFGAKKFKYSLLPNKGDVCEVIATQEQKHKAPIVKEFVPYVSHRAWYHLRRINDNRDFIMGINGFEIIEVDLDDDLFEI